MKKVVSIILALILGLVNVSFAATPSKTTDDFVHVDLEVEHPEVEGVDMFAFFVVDSAMVDDLSVFDKELEAAAIEIAQLTASESVIDYFKDAKTEDGEPVDLVKMIGENELNVFEFYPIVAYNYKPEMGKVTATMCFPTVYEDGEKVVVMIGIVTINDEGGQDVSWTALEGTGVAVDDTVGGVRATYSPELIEAIQDNLSFIAIVSK